MFRQMIAASAVALLATGAAAQQGNGVDRAPDMDANQPATDRLRADFDARFVDYDERMADYDRRLMEMERRIGELEAGVTRSGTGPGSTTEANQPQTDRVRP